MTMTREQALDVKVPPMEFVVMILGEGDWPSQEGLNSEGFMTLASVAGLTEKTMDSGGLWWWRLTADGREMLNAISPETREAFTLLSAESPRPEWAVRA